MSLFDAGTLRESEVTREFFFNIGGAGSPMKILIFLFAFVAFVYFAVSLHRRVKIWKAGRPELRSDYPEKRIMMLIKYVLLQRKVSRDRYAGFFHWLIFAGFTVLFIVTTLIFIQVDFSSLFFNYKFIEGDLYILLSMSADIAGLMILAGLIFVAYRRYSAKPTRLDHETKNSTFLLLLLLIVISGFFSEAMRIALSGFPDFESVASPAGYRLAWLFSFFDDKTLIVLHYYNWFLHVLIAFAFLAHLAVGKIGHIVISSLNIYFGNLENESYDNKFITADLDRKGVAGVEQFTWKALMDSEACLGCGRCQDVCPAFLTEKPLSPKKIEKSIRENMLEKFPDLDRVNGASHTPLISNLSGEVGSITPEEIWSCTNCGACVDACPVSIEQMPRINDMRRSLVYSDSQSASELRIPFSNMNFYGNAMGLSASERGNWADGIAGVTVMAECTDEPDFLFFAGCSVSYDERTVEIAKSFVEICSLAGFRVGILGSEETCCGDFALRSGNVELFEKLALKNIESFKRYNIKKIVTICPHGYNLLKKEYRKFFPDVNVEVLHHSEVILGLINEGKLSMGNSQEERVTFHDPCFLSRYNGIVEEPRSVLKALPGKTIFEPGRHGEKTLCCGSGGGRPLFEAETGINMGAFRVRELRSSGGETICTACPHCLKGLTSGLESEKMENIAVLDIAEIVLKALKSS